MEVARVDRFIELADPERDLQVQAVLARVASLGEVIVDGRHVHARADHGAAAVPEVLTVLESAGIKVASVTTARWDFFQTVSRTRSSPKPIPRSGCRFGFFPRPGASRSN